MLIYIGDGILLLALLKLQYQYCSAHQAYTAHIQHTATGHFPFERKNSESQMALAIQMQTPKSNVNESNVQFSQAKRD